MQTNFNGCQTANANVKAVVTILIICKQNQALIVWSPLPFLFCILHLTTNYQNSVQPYTVLLEDILKSGS